MGQLVVGLQVSPCDLCLCSVCFFCDESPVVVFFFGGAGRFGQ